MVVEYLQRSQCHPDRTVLCNVTVAEHELFSLFDVQFYNFPARNFDIRKAAADARKANRKDAAVIRSQRLSVP